MLLCNRKYVRRKKIVAVGSVSCDLIPLNGTPCNARGRGGATIQVREATAAQNAEWEQSRDQAISDGEIDLDAGNNPDEWNGVFRSNAPLKRLFCLVGHWEELPRGLAGCSQLLDLPEDIR
jgi:hypothetical protein